MSRTKISSQDRSNLIRLASSLSKGDSARRAILAGLKKAAVEIRDLPELPSGYDWEESDGGFALVKGSIEKGFIAQGDRSWLSYVANDESPIGRGQDSAEDAAYQLMVELGLD